MNQILFFVGDAPVSSVMQRCCVSLETVTRWRCGLGVPSADNLLNVGRYLSSSNAEVREACAILERDSFAEILRRVCGGVPRHD